MNRISNKNIVKTFVMSVLVSSLSFGSMAATLKNSTELSVLSVNGVPVENFKPNIELHEGKSLIEVKYQDLFDYKADSSGSWIRSESLYFTLDIAPKSGDYYEIIPPKFSSVIEAKKFLKEPSIQLSINTKRIISFPLQNHTNVMADMLKVHDSIVK